MSLSMLRHTGPKDLNIPYVYDFYYNLVQAEGIENHENTNVPNTCQGEATHTESIRGLNVAAVRITSVQVTKLPLQQVRQVRHNLLCKAWTDKRRCTC
jgi:hypothetical protein